MVERYEEDRRGAGWVWTIVGIVVAALLVWWIAASVSSPTEDSMRAQGPQAPFGATQQEDALAQLNRWTQQERSRYDEAVIDDGSTRLSGAAEEIASRFVADAPQQGSQTGGGPVDEAGESLQEQRAQLEASVEELKVAKATDYPERFYTVAMNFVALADAIQNQANIDAASEPLEQLHAALEELSADQPLDEQEPALASFFDRGTELLNTFAQHTQQPSPD